MEGKKRVRRKRPKIDFGFDSFKMPYHNYDRTVFAYGKKWYPFLVANEGRKTFLFRDYKLNQLNGKIIVAQKLKYYRYTTCESFTDLNKLIERIPKNERTLFEVILGEYPQKPHFDVDIDREKVDKMIEDDLFPEDIKTKIKETDSLEKLSNIVISTLLNNIERAFNEKNLTLVHDNIKIFTSSSKLRGKESYHIILMGYCHPNNLEAKAFYDEVTSDMDVWIKSFIDPKVYSPRQQFRILGNTKYQKNRFKRQLISFEWHRVTPEGNEEIINLNYTPFWTFSEREIKKQKLYLLLESLICQTTGCDYLPNWYVPRPTYVHEGDELTDKEVDLVMKKLKDLKLYFKKREVSGNMILLKRVRKSFCPICKREHEHENPYVIVVEGSIYWNCRRDQDIYGKRENQNMYVGTIEELGIDDLDIDNMIFEDVPGLDIPNLDEAPTDDEIKDDENKISEEDREEIRRTEEGNKELNVLSELEKMRKTQREKKRIQNERNRIKRLDKAILKK